MIDIAEIKARYSLAWKDWYYWPLEDDAGCKAARARMEAIGKELNAAKAMNDAARAEEAKP